jgi:uncharacterized SAM-binding protein YcdF (DUF218 family)
MLLVLSKVLASLFYPVGLSIALALAAAAAAWSRRSRLAVGLAGAAAGLLWFFSIAPVGHLLLRPLESRYAPLAVKPDSASAIVILGGATEPNLPPRETVEINESGDRLICGAKRYRDGWAPYIVLTGGKIAWISENLGTEASNSADFLNMFWGISRDSILLEEKAQTTRDHPDFVAAILEDKGLANRIILVTSAAHMIRAVSLFTKKGYTVYPAPADFRAETNPRYSLFHLLPQVGSLKNSTTALHEYYGLLAYKVMGWI